MAWYAELKRRHWYKIYGFGEDMRLYFYRLWVQTEEGKIYVKLKNYEKEVNYRNFLRTSLVLEPFSKF